MSKQLGSKGSELIFDHKYYTAEFWKSLSPEQRIEALKIYDVHRNAVKKLNQTYFGKAHFEREESDSNENDESDGDE